MSSMHARSDGRLFFDCRFRGDHCRELGALHDTRANRRKMEWALARIESQMAAGTFDYARAFPGSRNVA